MSQQIVISGVGGQGVLFITRIIAEAAIARGLAVLASETHGMAQRGGSVISHIKIGPFSSPLIRPGQADLLLALQDENVDALIGYLRPTGRAVINGTRALAPNCANACEMVDATALARQAGNPRAVNLVVLGHAIGGRANGQEPSETFLSIDHIESVLNGILSRKPELIPASLSALQAGFSRRLGS